MLNIAVRAARRAGSIINRAALGGDALVVKTKRANDFVTQVDRAAEEAIIEIVRKAYPDHGFVAEESGTTGEHAEYRWIIDPLDGTTNFIHGFPQYGVSIGIEHRGALAHAVVYDPSRNELFTASKGRGAFLNDRRVRVSKCARLQDALVGTGFPFKEVSRLDLYTRQLARFMQSAAGVRRAGAASLDLAYVACGRLDAFWELGLAPWDMAAGALLIQEAGWWATSRAKRASWNRGTSVRRRRRSSRRCSTAWPSGLERVVAHHFAHLDAVLGEPATAPPFLGGEVLGMVSPCRERFLRLELDDRDAFAVGGLILAVGNEPGHRRGELVHARPDRLELRLDSRLEPGAKHGQDHFSPFFPASNA